jgi:isopenicillin N synthase-like dioxygenase
MEAVTRARRAPAAGHQAGRDRFLDAVRTVALLRVTLWHAFGEPFLTYVVAAVPTIDVSDLVSGTDPDAARAVGMRIVTACEDPGFFQIIGHGVDVDLRTQLERAAREFFALDATEKRHIAMVHGGTAWRGWFPLGDELTAGAPDGKEGLYFGIELPPDDDRVAAGVALHGANLYPDRPAALTALVPRWIDAVTAVGRAVLRGISLGVGGDDTAFDEWCADPTVLFRIFHYPAVASPEQPEQPSTAVQADQSTGATPRWGVGEHTDYGLLTLLAQDHTGGLQVLTGRSDSTERRWVDVAPVPDAFVCNLGDMLERVSGGRFVATAHRVVAPSTDRISMPLFLDPGWDVELAPMRALNRTRPHDAPPGTVGNADGRTLGGIAADERTERWDGEDVHAVNGPYSEYLLSRVARVFPDLFAAVQEESTGV